MCEWEKMRENEGKPVSAKTSPPSHLSSLNYLLLNLKKTWKHLVQPTHFTSKDTENQKQRYSFLVVDLGTESGPQLPIFHALPITSWKSGVGHVKMLPPLSQVTCFLSLNPIRFNSGVPFSCWSTSPLVAIASHLTTTAVLYRGFT